MIDYKVKGRFPPLRNTIRVPVLRAFNRGPEEKLGGRTLIHEPKESM